MNPPQTTALSIDAALQLAIAHYQAGRLQEATTLYRAILDSDPRQEHHGTLLHGLKRFDQAETAYRLTLALRPDCMVTRYNLGVLLAEAGRFEEAGQTFRTVIENRPDHLAALCNLGVVLEELQRFEEAAVCYHKVLASKPDHDEACNNLSLALQEQGRLDEACAIWRAAVATRPEVATYKNWLMALTAQELLSPDAALEEGLRHLLRQDASLFVAVVISAMESMEGSRPEDLHLLASRAHALLPDHPALGQYWIASMQFVEQVTPEEVFFHTTHWARLLAAQLAPPWCPALPPTARRRLRIGYVATKLHFMFLEHLKHHDHNRFEIMLFTDDKRCQPLHFGPHVALFPLGPGDPTERLRHARLDIAIEMAGPNYRHYWRGIEGFMACAQRIAPIQAYCISATSTHGSASFFDYHLADRHLVPPDQEPLYHEKIKRLPHSVYCWSTTQSGTVTDPPCLTQHRITFGSANRGSKINAASLRRWARIVAAVPASRMIIKGHHVEDPLFRSRARAVFTQWGCAERLLFQPATTPPAFPGDFYSQIDISLDTHPYAGGITTAESLWNGVPVVTRQGGSLPSRLATAYLDAIGRREWIATTDDTFVTIALHLAMDQAALIDARHTLQPALASSPIMDYRNYARDLETLFEEMVAESAAGRR